MIRRCPGNFVGGFGVDLTLDGGDFSIVFCWGAVSEAEGVVGDVSDDLVTAMIVGRMVVVDDDGSDKLSVSESPDDSGEKGEEVEK